MSRDADAKKMKVVQFEDIYQKQLLQFDISKCFRDF